MPAFSAVTTEGRAVTEQDLAASAPTLLLLYRGWWCPTSKSQVDDLRGHYGDLAALGVTIYAASVDSPAEAAPMQEHVGSTITILCNVQDSFLEDIGVRDRRGAPWYDRIWFGAANRAIAMPAAIAIDKAGQITFAKRSTRVDERPHPTALIASLRSPGTL
jgi:peroxiredoxin